MRSACAMKSSWLGTLCVIGVFGRVVSETLRTFMARSRSALTSNFCSTSGGGGFTVITTVFLYIKPDVSLRTL